MPLAGRRSIQRRTTSKTPCASCLKPVSELMASVMKSIFNN